eukprot:6205048-Pleurochrysis_carterae.AAC.2
MLECRADAPLVSFLLKKRCNAPLSSTAPCRTTPDLRQTRFSSTLARALENGLFQEDFEGHCAAQLSLCREHERTPKLLQGH